MNKVIYTCSFGLLLLWGCSSQVENQLPIKKTSENIVKAVKEKTLTIDELRFKVKENKDEINQLDKEIDELLKEI